MLRRPREPACGHPSRLGYVPSVDGTAWLILPTYNEAENIEAIVAAAGEVLAGAACPRATAC